MINIVIPMAGLGSRFSQAGFHTPKPFIKFAGKMMIEWVIDNLKTDKPHRFIFLARTEHLGTLYGQKFVELCKERGHIIVEVNEVTQGTACTILLAENLINNTDELVVANSDQFIEFDFDKFLDTDLDGRIAVFNDTDPKWSFCRVDKAGLVKEVAEKNPISDIATCGIYYWSQGKYFVESAKRMIEKNIRVNNEFYTVPTYNEITDTHKIGVFYVEKMWGLGTPPDLLSFINKYVLKN